MSLCYYCKKPKEDGKIFCKECEDKPREKGTGTLIIWDKV